MLDRWRTQRPPGSYADAERLAARGEARRRGDLSRPGHHEAGNRILPRKMRKRRKLVSAGQESAATKRPVIELRSCVADTAAAQSDTPVVPGEPAEDRVNAPARLGTAWRDHRDAHEAAIEREVRPELAAHDLAHLPLYTAAVRLGNEGQPGRAFTLRTEALPPGQPDRAEAVRESARRQNGVRREEFERQFAASQRRPAEAPDVQREVRAAIPSSTDAPPIRRPIRWRLKHGGPDRPEKPRSR